jgi:hypothetical protein
LENDHLSSLKLGWSEFAMARHKPAGKHTWFDGTHDELLALARNNWSKRRPGAGRSDLSQVVIVPVEPAGFTCTTVAVDETTVIHAIYDRRQRGEEGFVRVTAEGPREYVKHAAVVFYSAATLEENNGTRSGDYDWEVVCLLAGPHAEEPMDPITMARNMLEKPGGTYCAYSAAEFAASIWYWSSRAAAHVD